jgi:hypothetical protein
MVLEESTGLRRSPTNAEDRGVVTRLLNTPSTGNI